MKKILSLVLVIAMMASALVFAPAASAEEGWSLEVSDAVATKGETVTLEYYVTGTTLRSFGLLFDFDETRLENPVITVNTDDNLASAKTIGGFPYADATVTSAVDGDSIDISEGYLLGTITLTVKEDAPAGDAHVRFTEVPGDARIYLGPTSNSKEDINSWTMIDGVVTVLPEGYAKGVPAAPASDFTYTIDGEGNATITAYTGSASEVAIPAYVPNGDEMAPVTKIAERAFITTKAVKNTAITKLILPATVAELEQYALVNLENCMEVYVYNSELEIGDYAIGYHGVTYSSKKKAWDFSKLELMTMLDENEETVGSVVIYCFEDSTAYTYTQEYDPDYYLSYELIDSIPTTVTVVAGDTTNAFEVSGNEIVAPGASSANGKSVIAWKVNGTNVAPGAKVGIAGDTTFEAVTITTPETAFGASIKAADAALRFTATLNVADYAAIVDAFGAENVSHGMIISVQDQIEKAGAFTHDLGAVIDFAMTGCWKVEGDNYVLAASVKNFSASTLAKNYKFNAVAYIAVEIDGVTSYVYGDYDWTCARDAKTTLASALADYTNDQPEYGWINTALGKFN